ANGFWGPARVTARDGGLQLALGPKLVVPLKHWDGEVFTFSLVTENAPPGTISKATFDGDWLTLEYYDQGGKGTFTR
ncbi:MAG: serine hydrolase, partial [Mycobacterium sp.]